MTDTPPEIAPPKRRPFSFPQKLARGPVHNLLAHGLPIIVSVGAIPLLLIWLAVVRFGVLNIFFFIITFVVLGHSSAALDRNQQIQFLLLIVVSGAAFYMSAQAREKLLILSVGIVVYLAALMDTIRSTYSHLLCKVRWAKLMSFG